MISESAVYYYQYHKTALGVRQVEKSARTFRSMGRDLEAKYRALHLPVSEEIATHLLLVRTSILKGKKANDEQKPEYEMAAWQLIEVEAKDISPEQPLLIPAYEELSNRELTKEQNELLQDLVKKYDKIVAVAKKKAATPVKPGDKKPWWRW